MDWALAYVIMKPCVINLLSVFVYHLVITHFNFMIRYKVTAHYEES